ncbi:hypothetical protein QWY86_15260 [Pedobacter aquatilis]|uniref:hypothetical protein n=1 Tax=Pedobacter aquatilis TaxID=351343 RepID=UPI0025B31F2B|nr:hypothetical protein [Pedobacter aquatilis]MDN3588040.1 hypothetical protein [Pedobacter aquatilis]
MSLLIEALNISYEDFESRYYHYDPVRKLHISESEFGYVWISTHGLVARKKPTTNRAVNSCLVQYTVISLLLNKAIEVVKDEKVYDIDSRRFEELSDLSPAIFHNLTFYVEVFCKAYLSLIGIQAPKSHKLQVIYQTTVDSMISNNHDDSLFQILVLDPLYKLVDHIGKIPGGFKEQFIKYDDNPLDDTVILFELAGLTEMTWLLELSVDFITDFFHIGTDTHYLKSNIYQRMIDRADTEEKKKRIQVLYPHLAKKIT